MRKRKPHTTIDRHIGRRIRERRTLLGMSQRELAQLLGVEPPMLSRYEIADTTVTASRLYEIARILRSSPEYFFEGFDDHHSMEFSARQRLLLS
ncbi:MAG TPA: helix-turn-helix transcriptional regulator, partial [Nitrospira sp.]|nr:helix-turn-helix transcriptional regulator [Nitrospira sp.]